MPSGGQNKLSRADLRADLTGLARALGETPTQAQYTEHGKHSVGAAQRAFGSWNGALEACDLDVNHRRNTRVTVDCANCGTAVEKQPSEIEGSEYNYCSQDCHYEHKQDRYSGDGNPRSTLVDVTCAYCGETLQRPRWRRESREHHFCDYECMGEWRAENTSGEDSPNWEEFPTKECEQCGKVYAVKPSEYEESRFCSERCQCSGFSVERAGENNPRWIEFPTKVCENCGDEYKVKPAEAENSRFCSRECLYEVNLAPGRDHPRYNPDKEKLYYGPNWHQKRRQAVIRDQARCQIDDCSVTEPENIHIHGKGMDVHHIKPLRKFKSNGEIDHDTANRMENLVTLCRSCHRRVESDSHRLAV